MKSIYKMQASEFEFRALSMKPIHIVIKPSKILLFALTCSCARKLVGQILKKKIQILIKLLHLPQIEAFDTF